MASDIEIYLFRGLGVHALAAFTMEGSEFRLTLAPWSDLDNQATFTFKRARLAYFDTDPDEIDAMPWDIIAVSSETQKLELWKFSFACDGAEFGFTSAWPTEMSLRATA